MLELFPAGFEEIEQADGIELAAYTDSSGEESSGGGRALEYLRPDLRVIFTRSTNFFLRLKFI